MTSPPYLAAPGAGLPLHEAFIARYVMMPWMRRTVSWEKAAAWFQTEGDTILGLVRPLDEEVLRERVLIPRFLGIEDSSRYWSPAMTVQHLVLAGEGMRAIMADLRAGQEPKLVARVENVKPDSGSGPEALEAFAGFLAVFDEENVREPEGESLRLAHPHPWFGPLDIRAWHVLAAMHQKIHRTQIEKILALRAATRGK